MTESFGAKPWSMAVKAVIVDDRGRTLLLRRSPESRNFAGCWEWPGGKVEEGESFADAVVRETREEAGLDIEISGLAGATEFEMPLARIVLLCMTVRVTGGRMALSHEHDAFAWVPWDRFEGQTFAGCVGDFMTAYARRQTGRAGSG